MACLVHNDGASEGSHGLSKQPLDVTQDAIVQGGKIKFFNTTFTPESGAKLQAARQKN
jgi:hypothetical protein